MPYKKKKKPAKTVRTTKAIKMTYTCSSCRAYCCSFPIIELSEAEVLHMAKGLNMTVSAFKKKHVKRNPSPDSDKNGDDLYIFKQKRHPTNATKTICNFYVQGKGCSVYDIRPKTCHGWGSDGKCNIYDFLASLRDHTNDKSYEFHLGI